MADLYPIYTDLTNRPVLIVGGGNVAQRKVLTLLDCAAQITVISPALTDELTQLAQSARITAHRRPYQPSDLDNAWLVIAASDDADLNRRIFEDASAARIFCNVVDQPDLCTFQVPAVVKQGPLQIAVSTSGTSPALAARIAQDLHNQYDTHYATLLTALKQLRDHLKTKYPDEQPRRAQILQQFLDTDPITLLEQNHTAEFQNLLKTSSATKPNNLARREHLSCKTSSPMAQTNNPSPSSHEPPTPSS